MTRFARLSFALFALVSVTLLGSGPAGAFLIPKPASTLEVVEYHNAITGHYFMTASAAESAQIEAGSAGPGWIRTGLAFRAYAHNAPSPGLEYCSTYLPQSQDLCGPQVHRFYGPGPNSHVFTADVAEARILLQPNTGWIFEEMAFRIPVPDAQGQCPSGHLPVVRLYNDRFRFNDSNHRYVTSEAERARMRSRGWIDEGARFCTPGAVEVPIKSFALDGMGFKVMPSVQCEDESVSLGPCIAVNNLTPPSHALPAKPTFEVPPGYFERTGFTSSRNYVQPALASYEAGFTGAFVQGLYGILGIHVDTAGRGASIYSSINPLYQFRTTVAAGARDERVFPFASGYEADAQLSISGTLNVKRLRVANASSHAYGHPTLEFIDQRSGKHLYFTALAYGTVSPDADYLAPDVVTGKVIVGTSFRASTPFGRNLGIPALRTPSGFVAESSWGWGGPFDFRIDRAEFQRILDAARAVDPGLSADPRDYLLDNFHFNNEVVGDGQIGLNLEGFKLQVLRR